MQIHAFLYHISPRLLCTTSIGQLVCPKQMTGSTFQFTTVQSTVVHRFRLSVRSKLPFPQHTVHSIAIYYLSVSTCRLMPARWNERENGKQQLIFRVKRYTYPQSYMFYDFHVSNLYHSFLCKAIYGSWKGKKTSRFLGDPAVCLNPVGIGSTIMTIKGV